MGGNDLNSFTDTSVNSQRSRYSRLGEVHSPEVRGQDEPALQTLSGHHTFRSRPAWCRCGWASAWVTVSPELWTALWWLRAARAPSFAHGTQAGNRSDLWGTAGAHATRRACWVAVMATNWNWSKGNWYASTSFACALEEFRPLISNYFDSERSRLWSPGLARKGGHWEDKADHLLAAPSLGPSAISLRLWLGPKIRSRRCCRVHAYILFSLFYLPTPYSISSKHFYSRWRHDEDHHIQGMLAVFISQHPENQPSIESKDAKDKVSLLGFLRDDPLTPPAGFGYMGCLRLVMCFVRTQSSSHDPSQWSGPQHGERVNKWMLSGKRERWGSEQGGGTMKANYWCARWRWEGLSLCNDVAREADTGDGAKTRGDVFCKPLWA